MVDSSIPWNLTLNYNLRFAKNFDRDTQMDTLAIKQAFTFTGDITLFKYWKVSLIVDTIWFIHGIKLCNSAISDCAILPPPTFDSTLGFALLGILPAMFRSDNAKAIWCNSISNQHCFRISKLAEGKPGGSGIPLLIMNYEL